MFSAIAGIFRDEQGNLSAARTFFAVWTALVAYAAWNEPAEPFWPLASGVLIGLLSWAAGPRIARYLAPTAGKVAGSVASAVRKKWDNAMKDDERGDYPERERVD